MHLNHVQIGIIICRWSYHKYLFVDKHLYSSPKRKSKKKEIKQQLKSTNTHVPFFWENYMQSRLSPLLHAVLSSLFSSPPPSVFASLLLLPLADSWPPGRPSQPGLVCSGSPEANLESRYRNGKLDLTFSSIHLACFTAQGHVGVRVCGLIWMIFNQSLLNVADF